MMKPGLILSVSFVSVFASQPFPKFTIDLNRPPTERFREVALHFKDDLPAMMRKYHSDLTIPSSFNYPERYSRWVAAGRNTINTEHKEELRGIVDVVQHADVTLDILMLWQMMYEMQQRGCSGVLMSTPEGKVMHGRDMDNAFIFQNAKGHWKNWPQITYEATWVRGHEPIGVSVQWAGHTSIHTGMRFGGWSFQQNTRFTDNDGLKNLLSTEAGARTYAFESRDVFLREPDFEKAVSALERLQINAPLFFVMSGSGPYQGAVISKDRMGITLPNTPPVQRLSPSRWYMIQANTDPHSNGTDFVEGEDIDPRTFRTQHALRQLKQSQVSKSNLRNVMLSNLLFNLFTVFTWIGIPADRDYELILPEWGMGKAFNASVAAAPAAAGLERQIDDTQRLMRMQRRSGLRIRQVDSHESERSGFRKALSPAPPSAMMPAERSPGYELLMSSAQ